MGKPCRYLLLFLAVPLSVTGQHMAPGYNVADREWLEQMLYRGIEWQPRVTHITGHEFFLTDGYIDGSVTLDGITFNNLKIRYDISRDNLIILWKDIHSIVLNSEDVDAFSLYIGSTKKNFINLHNRYDAISGFSEVIYNGTTMIVAKYTKVIGKNTSLTTYAQYRENDRLFFISGDECRLIRSRASFLKMLGDYRYDVKRYIRQNQLLLGVSSPEGFGPAAACYDSLLNMAEGAH